MLRPCTTSSPVPSILAHQKKSPSFREVSFLCRLENWLMCRDISVGQKAVGGKEEQTLEKIFELTSIDQLIDTIISVHALLQPASGVSYFIV